MAGYAVGRPGMDAGDLDFIAQISLVPLLMGAAAYIYLTARPGTAPRLLALFLAILALRPITSIQFLFEDDPTLVAALNATSADINMLAWSVFGAFLWYYPRPLRARSFHGATFLVLWAVVLAGTIGRFVPKNEGRLHDTWLRDTGGLQLILLLGCVSAAARVWRAPNAERSVVLTLVPVLALSPFTATGATAFAWLVRLARGQEIPLPTPVLERIVFVAWFVGPFIFAAFLAIRARSWSATALLAVGVTMGVLSFASVFSIGLFTLAFALRGLVPVHLGQRYGLFGLRRPTGAAAYVVPVLSFLFLFLIANALVISANDSSPFTAPLGVLLGSLFGAIGAVLALPRGSWGAPPERSDDALLLGRYRVLRRLGEGGQGVTHLCHDERLHRDVVVKTIRVGSGDALREARALARLRHPNVVTVLDAEQERDAVHIVMEHVERGSLRGSLAREGALSPQRAGAILGDVLLGIEACHAAGIIHRDVKPENILLTSEGSAKLADLGLARDATGGAGATLVGGVGTLAYMSPEQLRGEAVDARTDIYAAGVLLQEMLMGETPRVAALDAFEARERAKRGVRHEGAAGSGGTLPALLEAVVDRATRPARNDRFASAIEMRHALDEALAASVGGGSAPRVADEEREAGDHAA